VFVRHLATATTVRASVSSTGGEANATCNQTALSRDGRFVSFVTQATNLVSPTSSATPRVYVRDTQAPTTTRPTTTSAVWARMSGDGRYLAEQAPGVVLFDRSAPASVNLSGTRTWLWPMLSSNGRYVIVEENRASSIVLVVAANPLGP